MRELTVAAGAVRALMEFAVSRGARRGTVAQRARLDPSALEDRDERLPFSRYVALMRAGQELWGDPALAFHYLNGDALAVKEAAFRLGFSEPASFSRAFERWSGKSPGQVRRANQET